MRQVGDELGVCPLAIGQLAQEFVEGVAEVAEFVGTSDVDGLGISFLGPLQHLTPQVFERAHHPPAQPPREQQRRRQTDEQELQQLVAEVVQGAHGASRALDTVDDEVLVTVGNCRGRDTHKQAAVGHQVTAFLRDRLRQSHLLPLRQRRQRTLEARQRRRTVGAEEDRSCGVEEAAASFFVDIDDDAVVVDHPEAHVMTKGDDAQGLGRLDDAVGRDQGLGFTHGGSGVAEHAAVGAFFVLVDDQHQEQRQDGDDEDDEEGANAQRAQAAQATRKLGQILRARLPVLRHQVLRQR
jgi:hypothetical protein